MSKGRPPTPRSPQEKKALSYARDRRNQYGENDKASRKLIPIRKAQKQRRLRRQAGQSLAGVSQADDAAVDLIESNLRGDIKRVAEIWRKQPDLPLAEHLKRQRQKAEVHVGGKERRRKAQAERG